MSYPRSDQQILDLMENELRESDPTLVSAFAALVTKTRRPLGPRWERIGRGARFRARARWRRRRAGVPRARFPLVLLIPAVVFAVLSVLILTIPGSHQRPCGPAETTVRMLPHGIAECVPGAGSQHAPVQHPPRSQAHV